MCNMKKWHREIGTMYKIREFLNHLAVLGFNSSGYDIPLIKKWLFPELSVSHMSSPDDLGSVRFIKKGTKYTSVVVPGVIGGAGGLVFLDVMQYLAPGCSLDLFIQSFYIASDGDDGEDAMKSYFPYEYVTDYSVLSETTMPLYEAFFSTLRQSNLLDEEYENVLAECGLPLGSRVDALSEAHCDEARCPKRGWERYAELFEMWVTKGWRTVGDYLEYYNVQDVVPFVVAVKNYTLQFKDRGVDMYRDAISLPGVATHILSKYIGMDEMHFIDKSSLYNRIRYSEVGGQSIVFT